MKLDGSILEDPLKFVAACWPDIRLYEKQAEVLMSIKDNYETTVHAANEVGKDFTASLAVVWFFCSRSPCRVVTSSSGETQLKTILWSEIRERIATSVIDLGLDLQTLKITRKFNGKPDDLSYVIGHVTKTVENFQGHHLPHDIPRILAVFDECSGIADEFHTACESWAHRILNIGNPMNTHNYFYRNVKAGDVEDPAGRGGLLSKVIHISALDSPNVQVGMMREAAGIPGPHPNVLPGVLAYDEYIRRSQQWDKVKRHIRLKGLFYTGESSLCFPTEWLDKSEKSWNKLHSSGYDPDNLRKYQPGSLAMGIDCGAGRDLSVWTIIDRLGVVYQYEQVTPDTHKITQKTLELMNRFQINPARVCFDAGGGGKQIVDHMRARDRSLSSIRSISFGGSATPPPQKKVKGRHARIEAKEEAWVYKNKRAEMHGTLRKWMDPSINAMPFGIPSELYVLREDLAVLPMWFDNEGKMFLPPKDSNPGTRENPDAITIKKLLGRSPDRGDSLVLAVEALARLTKRKAGPMR